MREITVKLKQIFYNILIKTFYSVAYVMFLKFFKANLTVCVRVRVCELIKINLLKSNALTVL